MTAVAAGLGSVPMVFDYNLVLLFNEIFVTAGEPLPTLAWAVASCVVASLYESKYVCMCVCVDVPEAKDLETWLEVGGFAWNWMEPPLGTISFVLLCMQFARSQLQNLGIFIYLSMYVCREK